MSDHQIMEISYIYTTNRRCWFSYKNTNLICKCNHKSLLLRITWKLLLVTAVISSTEMLGFSGIKHDFVQKSFVGNIRVSGLSVQSASKALDPYPAIQDGQFMSRWPSPASFPIGMQLRIGFGSSFLIFLLLLYRCNLLILPTVCFEPSVLGDSGLGWLRKKNITCRWRWCCRGARPMQPLSRWRFASTKGTVLVDHAHRAAWRYGRQDQ